MAFVAGVYQIQFGTVAGNIGVVQDVGFTEVGFDMIIRPSFNPIRTDETGRTPVDGIWTGIEDLIIRAELIEWDKDAWHALTDFIFRDVSTTGADTDEGKVEPAGQLLRAGGMTDTLVLTPHTGEALAITGGGGATGGTYTFPEAYPLEPVRTIFSSQRLRSTSVGFYIFGGIPADHVTTMYSAVYT